MEYTESGGGTVKMEGESTTELKGGGESSGGVGEEKVQQVQRRLRENKEAWAEPVREG